MAESELSDTNLSIDHYSQARRMLERLRDENRTSMLWAKATERLVYCLWEIAQVHHNAEQVDNALQCYDAAVQLITEDDAQGYKHRGSDWTGCHVRHIELKQLQLREPHRFPEWTAAQAGVAVLPDGTTGTTC